MRLSFRVGEPDDFPLAEELARGILLDFDREVARAEEIAGYVTLAYLCLGFAARGDACLS